MTRHCSHIALLACGWRTFADPAWQKFVDPALLVWDGKAYDYERIAVRIGETEFKLSEGWDDGSTSPLEDLRSAMRWMRRRRT